MKKLALFFVVAGFTATAALANGNHAQTNGQAGVRIVAPLTIEETQILGFGILVPDGDNTTADDRCTIDPNNGGAPPAARQCTPTTLPWGNENNAPPPGGNPYPAQRGAFLVTGESGGEYAITLPSSFLVTSGANNMTVDTLTVDSGGLVRTLVGGTDTFYTGGTLHVGETQPAGVYTGTYTVMVDYT